MNLTVTDAEYKLLKRGAKVLLHQLIIQQEITPNRDIRYPALGEHDIMAAQALVDQFAEDFPASEDSKS